MLFLTKKRPWPSFSLLGWCATDKCWWYFHCSISLKTRRFCNVNLFLISLIFFFWYYHSFFFLCYKNLYFCQSAFCCSDETTRRLWSMRRTDAEVPLCRILWRKIFDEVQSRKTWFRICFVNETSPRDSLCLKDFNELAVGGIDELKQHTHTLSENTLQ